LAKELTVHTSVQVTRVEKIDGTWQATDKDGQSFNGRSLVLAIPPDQARVLLGGHAMVDQFEHVRAKPVWAILLGFDSPVSEGFVKESLKSSVVSEANVMPDARAVVLHLSDGFTQSHLELRPEEVVEKWMKTVSISPPRYAAAHRWRYALTTVPLGKPFLWDTAERLGITGDWCLGASIADAVESGTAIGNQLATQIR
jgi:renalase